MQTTYTDLELEWDEDRGGPTDDERDPRNLISAPEGGELYKSTAKALPRIQAMGRWLNPDSIKI